MTERDEALMYRGIAEWKAEQAARRQQASAAAARTEVALRLRVRRVVTAAVARPLEEMPPRKTQRLESRAKAEIAVAPVVRAMHEALLDVDVRSLLPAAPPDMPSLREETLVTVEAVAWAFHVDVAQVLGDSHLADVVQARHAAWLLVRELVGASLKQIGRQMCRHHTTVLAGVRRAQIRIGRDARYSAQVSTARQAVQQILPLNQKERAA